MPVYRLASQGYLGDGDLTYQNSNPDFERNPASTTSQNGDPDQWWGQGNAQGSEKLDGFSHAAANTADTAGFDKAVAKNAYKISSASDRDAEPKS